MPFEASFLMDNLSGGGHYDSVSSIMYDPVET